MSQSLRSRASRFDLIFNDCENSNPRDNARIVVRDRLIRYKYRVTLGIYQSALPITAHLPA